MTTTSPVDRLLTAICAGAVPADLYTPDVELDATVPGWRMRHHGAAAVAAEYARWFADPGELTELHRRPTADGEVVEYTLRWSEGGASMEAHHVHVLTLDPTGTAIAADHVWCGGRWEAALVAQMDLVVAGAR